MHPDLLHLRLVNAVTTYDRKQTGKRGFNPYALPQYLERAEEICADVAAGASVKAAICAGFTGPLRTACLRAVGESPDRSENRSLLYSPASARA